MKINRIIYKIGLLIILIVLCNSCGCYATDNGLPDLSLYEPSLPQSGSRTESIIESILGVFLVLGVVAVTISIALLGFSSILGSASEKAVTQERYVGVIFAGILLIAGSAIARLIISVAQNI